MKNKYKELGYVLIFIGIVLFGWGAFPPIGVPFLFIIPVTGKSIGLVIVGIIHILIGLKISKIWFK